MKRKSVEERRTEESRKDKIREMRAHDRKPRAKREKEWGNDYWAADRLKVKKRSAIGN